MKLGIEWSGEWLHGDFARDHILREKNVDWKVSVQAGFDGSVNVRAGGEGVDGDTCCGA